MVPFALANERTKTWFLNILLSDAGKLYLTIKPGMMDLAYLVSLVLPALKDVTACGVVDYYHVLRVKGEHFMILGVRLHVAQVDALP
jgi:hypothetical protein